MPNYCVAPKSGADLQFNERGGSNVNLVELLDRPIAFHRPFVELGLGVTGALFLSQALYWSRRTNSSGYFSQKIYG